jgi:hypothetical protein
MPGRMIWVVSGSLSLVVIMGVYLHYRRISPGPTDRAELQRAYQRAANRLGLLALVLFVVYVVGMLLLR